MLTSPNNQFDEAHVTNITIKIPINITCRRNGSEIGQEQRCFVQDNRIKNGFCIVEVKEI